MMHETFSDNQNGKLRPGETSVSDLGESVLEFYIDGEDDLIGLLAYALYERQRRDWIVSHRRRHGGRTPTEAELAAVTSNYLSQDLRNTLRDRAAQILAGYAETFVEAIEPQIRISTLNSEALRQARDLEESVRRRSGFWRQLRLGFLVALIVVIVIAAAAFGAIYYGPAILEALRGLAGPSMRT